MYKLTLPNRNGANATSKTEEIDIENNSVVITGPNGSGKTRLTVWLENASPQKQNIHRISAQRSLSIPEDGIDLFPSKKAENYLLVGRDIDTKRNRDNIYSYRMHSRWGGNPVTHILSDFPRALSLLFARRTERDRKYTEFNKQNVGNRINAPDPSPDEILVNIWQNIFPHCRIELDMEHGFIFAYQHGESKRYHGYMMSDGERSALYLMSQVLSLPKDMILVIDEPELHFHRSILYRLWSELESVRDDLIFIYITHDLDFAASRRDAKKLWVHKYSNETWMWDELPDYTSIPENLALKILGSRHDVIFVEGDYESLDYSLYQAIFPTSQVIPCGNGDKVIENTKAFRSQKQFHHLEVYGLIDRDRRPEGELEKLASDGIFALEVSEVEMLYCIPEIIEEMIDWNTDSNNKGQYSLDSIKAKLFERISSELDQQILQRTQYLVEYKVRKLLGGKHKNHGELEARVNTLQSQLDVNAIRQESENAFNQVLQNRDYIQALRIFNQKGFVSTVASYFGLSHQKYIHVVNKLIRSSEGHIILALRSYLPEALKDKLSKM